MSIDQDDPENGKAQIDAHTLLHCIELCRNGLIFQDEENGTAEYPTFLSGLADLLNNEANGPVNGDRSPRKRGARDNGNGGPLGAATRAVQTGTQAIKGASSIGEAAGRRSPGDDFNSFTGRGSMDRRTARDRRAALDSAITLKSLSTSSFYKRFPDARKISVR